MLPGAHWRKILATLIRLLRVFDLAEEALRDAFIVAAKMAKRRHAGQSQRLADFGRALSGTRQVAPACPLRCAQAELAHLLTDTEPAE